MYLLYSICKIIIETKYNTNKKEKKRVIIPHLFYFSFLFNFKTIKTIKTINYKTIKPIKPIKPIKTTTNILMCFIFF